MRRTKKLEVCFDEPLALRLSSPSRQAVAHVFYADFFTTEADGTVVKNEVVNEWTDKTYANIFKDVFLKIRQLPNYRDFLDHLTPDMVAKAGDEPHRTAQGREGIR